jgi:hypothetical protein
MEHPKYVKDFLILERCNSDRSNTAIRKWKSALKPETYSRSLL